MYPPVRISLPYGRFELVAEIPKKNFKGFFSVSKTVSLENLENEIKKSLNYPIQSKSLATLAKGAKRALILVDDITRQTPAHIILPFVIEALQKGDIYKENISILFALGSHRLLKEDEMRRKVGEEIFDQFRFYNHDYKAPLSYIGRTNLGTPIYVNPLLKEHDLIVGIGSILPHRYCGWSGGGKIVQPGVCGKETVTATHLLVTKDPNICLGSESNAALDEIRYVARTARLNFIVNTIYNGAGDVTDIVAGAPVPAHEEGIRKAKKVFGVAMPKCDILIVSAYPEEANLWQAFKALYAAHLVVHRGGRIILVAQLEEGIGEHPDLIRLMTLGIDNLMKIIRKSQEEDMLCLAAAYAGAQVMEHASIDIVSNNLDKSILSGTSIGIYTSLQDAVDNACSHLRDDDTIVVLREGTIALPIVK